MGGGCCCCCSLRWVDGWSGSPPTVRDSGLEDGMGIFSVTSGTAVAESRGKSDVF